MISLTVSYPPSANRLWRAVKGRQIKSAEYRAWLTENQYAAVARFGGVGVKSSVSISGPYELSIVVTAPDKRRRDLDNLAKPLGDLIQHLGLVADDRHMRRLTMEWGSAPQAGVQLTITELG